MNNVGNGDIAEFASVIFLTMLLYVDFITLNALLVFLNTGIDIVPSKKWVVILISVILASLLYFLLISNGRSIDIIKQYENELPKKQNLGRIIIIVYIISTIGLLMFSFYIQGEKIHL